MFFFSLIFPVLFFLLYYMFEEGFKWWNLGRASAVAFLLFLIILGVTTVMLRFGRKRDLV